MKILLDTNFIIYCAKQKIGFIEQIEEIAQEGVEIYIPSAVIEELKKLEESAKKASDKNAASLALNILNARFQKGRIQILASSKIADNAIVEFASKSEEEVSVATSDRELKNRLKGKARIISIRQKKKIAFIS